MKNYNSTRCDFRIPISLLNQLTDKLGLKRHETTKAVHMAINKVLLDGKTYSDYYYRPTPHYDFSHNETMPLFCFREKSAKLEFLQYYYRTEKDCDARFKDEYTVPSITTAIRYAIMDTINDTSENFNNFTIKSQDRLVPYIGQKNSTLCKEINTIFDAILNKNKIDTYIEPFTGSANVYLHFAKAKPSTQNNTIKNTIDNVILNDLNYNIVCLLKTIRDEPVRFKTELHQTKYTREVFNNFRDTLFPKKNKKIISPPQKSISPFKRAVMLYYLLSFSSRAKCENIIVKKPHNTDVKITNMEKLGKLAIHNSLIKIARLSNKLNGVTILNMDALELIKQENTNSNTLFYIDSPYFLSEDVYQNMKNTSLTQKELLQKNEQFHKELSEQICAISRANNFFVASNRVTVSFTRKADFSLSNKDALDLANKFYSGKGFYYKLLLFKDNDCVAKKQVEILISNFCFPKSKPYTENITEEELNKILYS